MNIYLKCISKNFFSNIWERRSNLQGRQFNAAIGHWRPFTYNIQPKEVGKTVKTADGYVMDVMEYLKNQMNFTLNLTYVKGWSNIVNLIHEKKFELGCTGFSHTLSRSKLVDFSFPMAATSLRMFYARDPTVINWSLYFYSFQMESWFGFILSFILSTGVFLLISYLAKCYTIQEENQNYFSIPKSLSFMVLSQVNYTLNSLVEINIVCSYTWHLSSNISLNK